MDKDNIKETDIRTLIHDLRGSITNIKLTNELVLSKKLGEITEMQQELLEQTNVDCLKLEQILVDFLKNVSSEHK